MTNEEAIKTIKCAISEVEWEYPIEYAAAFDKAIEALEMQIPVKPVPKMYECEFLAGYKAKFYNYNCKVCGHQLQEFQETAFGNIGNRFCGGCGQAIDWKRGKR